MSNTYTAWDGEERSWPPPENWYRAADGRWWHPAYGPDDEPGLASEAAPVPEATPEPEAAHEAEATPEPEAAHEAEATPVPEATPEPEAAHEARPPDRKPLVAALIVAVVLLTAAVASIVGRPPDDPATARDNEAAAPDANDDSAQPSAASGSRGELNITIDDFRRSMGEHGLSTGGLTNQQITGFASTYCAHAADAKDRAAFDELRRRAIAEAGSELTPIQLDLTITTAVAVFCPDDSDRLGLSRDRSGP